MIVSLEAKLVYKKPLHLVLVVKDRNNSDQLVSKTQVVLNLQLVVLQESQQWALLTRQKEGCMLLRIWILDMLEIVICLIIVKVWVIFQVTWCSQHLLISATSMAQGQVRLADQYLLVVKLFTQEAQIIKAGWIKELSAPQPTKALPTKVVISLTKKEASL
jgi:hypothetical protein